MSLSEKVFQGPKVVVNRFGWNLAQKLGVMRYFKSHFGSLLWLLVLELQGESHFWPFCYPALLTVNGWFHFLSSKGLGKSEVTSILLTEAPTCLYNQCMYGHAPLLMGIYNNYSGHYKVRRRLYVNERFVKLTLSGKSIKNGPDKIWRLSMFGVMLRNMTWNRI